MKKQKKDEIPSAEKVVLTPEQLIELLKNSDSIYVAIIQGASGSGKTRLLLRIAAEFKDVVMLSYEELVWRLVDAIRMNKQDLFVNYVDTLSQYKIVGIEDVDFLEGKTATQEELSIIINRTLKFGTYVFITGIQLEWRVPILISEISEGKLIWVDM